MIIADAGACLEVSGSGEVLEPSDGVHGAGRAAAGGRPARGRAGRGGCRAGAADGLALAFGAPSKDCGEMSAARES
jgi:hypothetical protein